jgi:hypothetical protein
MMEERGESQYRIFSVKFTDADSCFQVSVHPVC